MAVIEVDVPAQDSPDLGQRARVIHELDQGGIQAGDVDGVDATGAFAVRRVGVPTAGDQAVHQLAQLGNLGVAERVFDDQESIALEGRTASESVSANSKQLESIAAPRSTILIGAVWHAEGGRRSRRAGGNFAPPWLKLQSAT